MTAVSTKKSKDEAQKEVPPYVQPGDCFVQDTGNKNGWRVMPGTGCAHWVAHQFEIKGAHAKCEKGYECRVVDLVKGMSEVELTDVKASDVWAGRKGAYHHCGIVVKVEEVPDPKHSGQTKNRISIQHCSNKQSTKKLPINDWETYFSNYVGKFYRLQRGVVPPSAQANAVKRKYGLT